MSIVRLLVLGVVRTRGRVHGYAIHRELVEWRVDTWTSVKPGSIYHALKQLTKERKLREVGVEESAEGPGRMLYELSEEGTAEFFRLLESALSSFQLEALGAGIAFMQTLPRRRVIDLLKDQRQRALSNRDGLEMMIPTFPNHDQAPHTADLLALWGGALASMSTWTGDLIHRLENGEYTMADDSR